jgi:superfamily II DNA or RNA helicase
MTEERDAAGPTTATRDRSSASIERAADISPPLAPVHHRLRPYQADVIDEIERAVAAGCRRLIVQLPTGGGKTVIAANLALRCKRVIFTVPALSLIDQTVTRFMRAGIYDVGVMQADHPMTDASRPVQIASVQTLMRRVMPPTDLVLIDEVHRWYKFYCQWLKHPDLHDVPFIGLTATPWTRGLGRYFNKLIVASTTRELIREGYLSPFRVFAPASPDLTGVRVVAGDYKDGDLSKAMDQAALVADVVDTWLDRGENRPTLCFAVDRAHAKHLQSRFIEAGVPAGYIDAYTDAAERNHIARQFHDGSIKVVCNVGCLTTGIDWDVRCIILARPTRSEILFVQMIGRGLRIADGKVDCLILDHSDNHIRLGFVDDIHHDTLDNGRERQKTEPKKTEALPKKCPSCTFLKPPKALVCPACGFAPQPKCDVVNKDGELVEFTSRRTIREPTDVERQIFYAELRWIGHDRGYKAGWAAQQFRSRFGYFPPWSWNDRPTCEPSRATLSWIKSQQIAYAKSRGAF